MSDDYVKASRLELTILRPKKTVVSFGVDMNLWDELWHLEHPRYRDGRSREIKPEDRAPTVFKLALVSLPRRVQPSDLTASSALALARGEMNIAKEETAGDRQELGRRIAGRDAAHEDNRRHGTDRNRGRD